MLGEGFDTYGIDLSDESLKLCEQMLEKYNTKAKLSVQDMSAMDFDSNIFDAVVDVFSSYCLNSQNGGYIFKMYLTY